MEENYKEEKLPKKYSPCVVYFLMCWHFFVFGLGRIKKNIVLALCFLFRIIFATQGAIRKALTLKNKEFFVNFDGFLNILKF